MVSTNHDKEIEELIKVAQQEGEGRQLSEVERFITENGIVPSEYNKIANFNIYELYEKWSENPASRESFFKEFSLHFKKCVLPRPEQDRGYLILCERIQHSEEARWKAYKYKRDKKAKRQEKKSK